MTIDQDKRIEEKMLRQMSRRSIMERFQGKVESVTIEYTVRHRSFAGESDEVNARTWKNTDAADFFIRCGNPECTERYFNLGGKVADMALRGEFISESDERCSGQTAPDYPNPRCGGEISYKITLQYTESCL